MVRFVAGIATAMLISAPAASSETPATSVADEKVPERLICKTSNALGSRLRKNKSCRTAAEWADLKELSDQKMRDYQRVGRREGAEWNGK